MRRSSRVTNRPSATIASTVNCTVSRAVSMATPPLNMERRGLGKLLGARAGGVPMKAYPADRSDLTECSPNLKLLTCFHGGNPLRGNTGETATSRDSKPDSRTPRNQNENSASALRDGGFIRVVPEQTAMLMAFDARQGRGPGVALNL